MNRKVNTALFILGATVFNLIVMVILILLGLLIVSLIFRDRDPGMWAQVALLLVFGFGIAGSFFVYNRIVRWISGRVELEKYFHPIIKPRKK